MNEPLLFGTPIDRYVSVIRVPDSAADSFTRYQVTSANGGMSMDRTSHVMKRYAYPYSVDIASIVHALIDNPASWGSHVATADDLSGSGPWTHASSDPGDPSYLAVKRTLDTASSRVFVDSNGMCSGPSMLILSARDARLLANTPEVNGYMQQATIQLSQLHHSEWRNSQWGIPDRLYGVELVVDLKKQNQAVIVHRRDKPATYGDPSFDTIQVYYRPISDGIEAAVILACPLTGFLITNLFD